MKKSYLIFTITFLCFLTFAFFSCTNPLFEQVLGLKTISFFTNGGSHVPDQKLFKGEKITRPKDPVRENSSFDGWFLDKDTLMHEWDFNLVPGGELTLHAKWMSFGVSLTPPGNISFEPEIVGYNPSPGYSKIITNIGAELPTGNLTITLSGAGNEYFDLSTTEINSIFPGDNDTFSIYPKLGLLPGTYTSVVTITNGSNINISFNVTFTVIPVPTVWVDIAGGAQNVPHADLKSALDSITTSGVYTVKIGSNQYLAPYARNFLSGTSIALTSEGTTASVILTSMGSLFTINNGVTFRLNNINLRGISDNNVALINVNGGNLVMDANTVITGNTSAGLTGGGVYVHSGIFTMNDGTISGNAVSGGGGGVAVTGTFTMTGGTISGNSAAMGGGVYVLGAGIFTKTGNGIIYGDDGVDDLKNTATTSGHAAYHFSTPAKKRDSTAGQTVNMDSSISGEDGGWDVDSGFNFVLPVITVDLPDITIPSNVVLSRSGTNTAMFKIDNPDDYSSIEWYFGTKKLEHGVSAGKGEELTLTVNGVYDPERPYDIITEPGKLQIITVEVVADADDALITRDISFQVVQ